jgi:hypothetical protein
MLMRRVSSKDKNPTGLLRTAMASGAAVVLATASMGALGTATASCFSFSGFGLGDGCESGFGSFAIVIGPSGDVEGGSTATAGNVGPFSPFNFAISVGSNTFTSAGTTEAIPGVPALGNIAFATAGSRAIATGIGNIASSLGGTRSSVTAIGVGNSAINLGSDNTLVSTGVVNNTTNFFGDNNILGSSNVTNPPATGLGALLPGFNVAFNTLGDRNTVLAGSGIPFPPFPPTGGSGPGAIAGAIGVNDQSFLNGTGVLNNNFGIELRTPFNEQSSTPLTNSQVSGGQGTGKQGGLVNRLLSFRSGGKTGSNATSLGGSGATFKSVSDRINTSVKKLSDAVNNVANSLAPKSSEE